MGGLGSLFERQGDRPGSREHPGESWFGYLVTTHYTETGLPDVLAERAHGPQRPLPTSTFVDPG